MPMAVRLDLGVFARVAMSDDQAQNIHLTNLDHANAAYIAATANERGKRSVPVCWIGMR